MVDRLCRVIVVLGCCVGLSLAADTRPVAASSDDPQYHYLRGLLEERAGNTSKALDAYQHVVAQDPQALEAFRDIGALQLRLGHFDEALRAGEKVRDLAPKDPAAYIFLGNVHVAQGEFAKAAESYEAALKLDPQNQNALENLGNYYLIVDPEKAIPYYQHDLELNPDAGDIVMQMGLAEQKLGHTDKALAAFGRASAIDPHQSSPYLAEAEIFEQKLSTAAAIAAYEKAQSIQPKNPLVCMRLGHAYFNAGQWGKAEAQFEAARTISPQDASVYYWIARVAEERKDWAKASDAAQQAFQYSQDPQFLPLAAYYMTLNHDVMKAVTWLERARKVDPTNANTLLFLGMNNLELGRVKEAHDALQQGATLYPKDAQMHFQLGVTEDRLGHADAAEAEFKTVLALDPKNAGAMNYLGYSWAEKGVHLDEAEKLLREAVHLEPDNAAFLDSLGWLCFKKNNLSEAQALLEKAAGFDDDAQILGHLADVQAARHNMVMAMHVLAQAASLDPKNDAVRHRLDQVAAQALPTLQPRQVLKEAEGNLRQVQNLVGRVHLQLRALTKSLPGDGRFYYTRPEEAVLDLTSFGKEGAVRFRLRGTTLSIEPQAQAARFGALQVDHLTDILRYFSGAITALFDGAPATRDGSMLRYKKGEQELWVDGKRGVITRFKRAASGGGFDEMTIDGATVVDGLWLPTELQVHNTASGWTAHLTFSDWIVNNGGAPVTPITVP